MSSKNGDFDSSWYVSEYPDVSHSGMTPEEHYNKYGILLGRYKNKEERENTVAPAKNAEKASSRAAPENNNTAVTEENFFDSDIAAENLNLVRNKSYNKIYKKIADHPQDQNLLPALVILYSQRQSHANALAAANKLFSQFSNQLPKDLYIDVLIVQVKTLIRMGAYDDAEKRIKNNPYKTNDKVKRLKVDLEFVRAPRLAHEALKKIKKPNFKDEVQLCDILSRAPYMPEQKAFELINKRVDKFNDGLKKSELLLTLYNFYNYKGEKKEAAKIIEKYYHVLGIDAPEFKNYFSIKNIDIPVVKSAPENNPDVSVIITAYNAENTIERSLRSVLAQTYKKIRVVVANDQSTDSTLEIVQRIADEDSRVVIQNNETNVGTYVGKSLAIKNSNTEFVTFHDADDWMHPDRIALHIEVMRKDANEQVVCSRSSWLRVNEEGEVLLTRWGKSFLHDNPASTFVRKAVFDEVGYFDSVRAGADSEFWNRLVAFYGIDKTISIKLPLSLGLRHEASLTTSGGAALNQEQYSITRDEYSTSWLNWHIQNINSGLHLDILAERKFSAPSELKVGLEAESEEPNIVYFGISLASKQNGNWEEVNRMLSFTIASIAQQTNGHWKCVICGHEKPEALSDYEDDRFVFITCDTPVPKDKKYYRNDKNRKRYTILEYVKNQGGGYFMPLDADDLVHENLVSFVQQDDNRVGYSARQGYAYDFSNDVLGTVPGVWDATFDQVCGSSALFYLRPDDIPSVAEKYSKNPNREKRFIEYFEQHGYWRVTSQEMGRPLRDIPFAASVYVLNHSNNLSFRMQRIGSRQQNILSNVKKHSVDKQDVLKYFGNILNISPH
ncbi:glycosyltransferase family 2 protein [Carnimonas bestiolae]|uniref:glycosyltransferase family 2 protein n=1 Tax=Carnimonas bestiolae TaxID=3402172 RepID=UPI003EDC2ECB